MPGKASRKWHLSPILSLKWGPMSWSSRNVLSPTITTITGIIFSIKTKPILTINCTMAPTPTLTLLPISISIPSAIMLTLKIDSNTKWLTIISIRLIRYPSITVSTLNHTSPYVISGAKCNYYKFWVLGLMQ